jgi:ribosomal protein L33
MAKKSKGQRQIIMLVSESGYRRYSTKNLRNNSEKLELKKYDPWIMAYAIFKEKKMPKHK